MISNYLKVIITSFLFVFAFDFMSFAQSLHYEDLAEAIQNYYRSKGCSVNIEPHGSRGPDIVGVDKYGNKIIGEIKKSSEINRDLHGYWSQWNSQQKFGGKKEDFQLKSQYSDKGETLSQNGKGWAAVIDGQLRGYCEKEGMGVCDLVVQNYEDYVVDINKTLDYLGQEGRLKGYRVDKDSKGNAYVNVYYNK